MAAFDSSLAPTPSHTPYEPVRDCSMVFGWLLTDFCSVVLLAGLFTTQDQFGRKKERINLSKGRSGRERPGNEANQPLTRDYG